MLIFVCLLCVHFKNYFAIFKIKYTWQVYNSLILYFLYWKKLGLVKVIYVSVFTQHFLHQQKYN